MPAPLFQRAPRILPVLPKGEVEIPAPPPAPTRQTGSLIAILLPGLMAVGGLIVAVTSATTGNAAISLMSFGFMGVTSIVSVFSYFSQRTGYGRAVREREQKYRALLEEHRQELFAQREQQQIGLCEIDPAPRECLSRVDRRDRRLWERAPQDNDFLLLRLGLGQQAFGITIKAPKQQNVLEKDPLIEEAGQIVASLTQVPDVPVCLPLRETGVAGLAGPRYAIMNTARALAMQIATHHSPDEVKIVALFPAGETDQWDWLRWLPHVWTEDHSHRLLANEKNSAHRLLGDLDSLLRRRKSLATGDSAAALPLPCFVFLFADPHLIEKEPIMPLLLTEGKSVGAFSIFLSDRSDALPRSCQATVELEIGQSRLRQTAPSTQNAPISTDEIAIEIADRLARSMAFIRLQPTTKPSEIPNSVTLLDLLGVVAVEDLDVLSWWHASEPFQSLAVPLGKRAGGDSQMLDLHERGHGPHGLVAGTSGSGKSELLQSLIASLAAHFHPHEVAFVLVDYKGGGMANAFLELPHLVGTITNLQGNLAMRALASLKAELQRRQRFFEQAGVNHIDQYQRIYRQKQAKEPLPHLILIVDEFAELKAEQPDFMRELISAVRVGRSLGVHLILATQKPAGVVDEQIWANSRFRICLRVERTEDSQEVLKRPDAANLTRPGRAYLQVGNNEIFELFQAAWGGAPYASDGAVSTAHDEILEISLDGSRHSLRLSPKPMAIQSSGNQLQALISYLHNAAEQEGIKRLQGPWMPPLPEQVLLSDLFPAWGWNGQTWVPGPDWVKPVVGLVDDPATQSQTPLSVNLGKEGHLAIYGAPGTGKTTLIQTLITSLALAHSPQDVNIYLLDFGGRLLTLYAPLPHVGGVVLTDEAERLHRLLRYLLREMERRKERFAKAGVGNLVAFRAASGESTPAIVVVLDNYTGFANTYPDNEDQLAQVAREGGNLGIHLVITAISPSTVKPKIGGNITMALALQLKDPSEYSSAVGRTGGFVPATFPGRGLAKGNPPLEFQTALAVSGSTEPERTAGVRNLIDQMTQAWKGAHASPIPLLPDVVPLDTLVQSTDTWPTPPADNSLAVSIGLDVDELESFKVDLFDGPHFMIAGSMQSGKTTLLQSWLLALADQFAPERLHFYLVDFRRAGLFPLARLPHVKAYVEDDDRFGPVLADITQILRERRQLFEQARHAANGMLDERAWLANQSAILLAIDDFDAFRDGAQPGTKDRLDQLIRRERGLGFHVVLAGTSSDLTSAWDNWIKALKEMQTGFLLGSNEQAELFNLQLPYGEARKSLPPGQGYFARRGRYRKIQVANSQAGTLALGKWVERIGQRDQK